MTEQLIDLLAKPEWKPGRNFSWLYVKANGEIIGSVNCSLSGTYYSDSGNRRLGEFYTEAQAKKAVEGD